MNELIDIIIIYFVFRVITSFLGAWWHGDKRNDFRRDRQVIMTNIIVEANISMFLQDYYVRTLTDGVPTIGFTHPCHFLDKVLF